MKSIVFVMTWVFFCTVGFAMQLGVASEEIWLISLVIELNKNPPLQSELDMSPKQVEMLQAVVAKREFGRIVQDVGLLQRPKTGSGDAFFDADQQVLKLLDGVLESDQVSALRRSYVKLKFGSRFAETLRANSVMRYIGVDHIATKYNSELERILKQNESVLRRSEDRHIRQFLALLPTESQRKMAQIVGGKYYSADLVESDQTFEALPFPGSVKSVEMLEIILSDREYEIGLRLTTEQRMALEKIAVESAKELEQVMALNSAKFGAAIDELNVRNRQRSATYFTVLDARQKLSLGRITIQKQLEHDIDLVVKLPGLQSYLNMDEASWKKFVSQVDDQNRLFADEKRRLNRKMLQSLGKAMGSGVEKRLNFLFLGVW